MACEGAGDDTEGELKSHRRSPMTNGRVSFTPIAE